MKSTLRARFIRPPRLLLWVVLVLATISPIYADDPPSDLLRYMDARTAEVALQLAKSSQTWRTRIAQLKQLRAGEQSADSLTASPIDQILGIAYAIEEVATASPKLASYLRYEERIGSLLKEAENRYKKLPFDPAVNLDTDEATFREEAKQVAQAYAAKRIFDLLDKNLLNDIDRLRDPAEYAKRYLDGRFREWTQKPLPLNDQDSLVFRIIPPPQGVSIFDPDARLTVEIDYVPQEIVVRATGLYFRYREPLPEAVIDELKVDPQNSISAGAAKKLKQLGNEALAELSGGTGFVVTIKKLPDLTRGRGAIEFDVKFDATKMVGTTGSPITASAKDLQLYPVNRVELGDAEFNLTYRSPTPIPIGSSPFAFWEFGGSFKPATRLIGAKTSISTVATEPEAIGLYAQVKTQPPFDKFDFDGNVSVADGGWVLCELEDGTIDFSRGVVKATYTDSPPDPSNPLSLLKTTRGSFELRSERAILDGAMDVFGVKCANMHMEINFDKRIALVTAKSGFELFGAEFARTFTGEIGEDFKRLRFKGIQAVEVPVEPWGDISCTVEVELDTDRNKNELVAVRTRVLGELIEFSVGLLDQCTLERLAKEIGGKVSGLYRQVLNDLANGEDATRDWAAQFDSKTRRYFAERWEAAGLERPRTGIRALDDAGGYVADQSKALGGALQQLTQNVGGGLTGLRRGIQDGVHDLGSTVGRGVSDAVSAIAGGGLKW